MKFLKYFLLFLLGLIAIYLLLCLAGPKDMNVIKATTINAPASIPFNLANDLKKTELWNEWTLSDSTIVVKYNDIPTGAGAKSSWSSEMSGNGTQKILTSVSNKQVKSELTFEGWDGSHYAEINLNEEGGKTNVSYSFEGTPLPFLMRGFALVMRMKKSMHTNYEKSLENLKKISEDRAKGIYNGYEIREELLDEKHFVMRRQEVNKGNIQQYFTNNLGALFRKVQTAGIEMTGMPCGLFFKWPEDGEQVIDMAAAIPVGIPISVEDAASYSIPSQNAIVMDFYGDYKGIKMGHDAILEYMHDRGYLQDPPMIEEFVTDPGIETDPSKWLTRITQYFSLSQ